MQKLIVFIVFLVGGIWLMNNFDYNHNIKQEKEALLKENESLKHELDELKNGAQKLFQLGKSQFENNSFNIAIETFNTLISKHPVSKEATDAKEMIKLAEQEIKKQNDIDKIEKEKKAKDEKDRLAKATSKMEKRRDDIKGITWFYQQALENDLYLNGKRTNIHLYVGKPDGNLPFLRAETTYHGDSWLFIHSMIIVVDGVKFPFTNIKFDRDHSSKVWEWNDMLVKDDSLHLFKSIADSNKTVIRFEGNQYYRDHTVTKKEKEAIIDVLDVYKALKN